MLKSPGNICLKQIRSGEVPDTMARERSDLHKKDIKFANPEDRHEISSHIEEYFWSPMALSLTPDGHLYVIESNRHRIQIFKTVI